MTVKIQSEDFDLSTEIKALEMKAGASGAVVTFSGLVRGGEDFEALELEHYPAMTTKALEDLETQAHARWDLSDILIIHRFGKLKLGEQIMLVVVGARHRKEAFEAAEFLMDFLKNEAPFWKKEHLKSSESWVDPTKADLAATDRWKE